MTIIIRDSKLFDYETIRLFCLFYFVLYYNIYSIYKMGWAQDAGKYYKSEKKSRPTLSFGDALKELSKLRKSGNMPSYLGSSIKTLSKGVSRTLSQSKPKTRKRRGSKRRRSR
jgi:hypothetical protein